MVNNKKTCLVLFSDDFRIKDNPALYFAAEDFDNIIPLYIYNENYLGRKLGSASKVFLNEILKSFNELLNQKCNVSLIIKKGNILDVLSNIIKNNNIDAIYFNHSYTEKQILLEKTIKQKFTHLTIKSFKSKTLFEPEDIKNKEGEYFKVFTPFSKECLKNKDKIEAPLPEPKVFKSEHNIETESIEHELKPKKTEGNWDLEMLSYWAFDYDKIEENFYIFLDKKLNKYSEDRNIPSKNGTSSLSPYLRFGLISPRFCFYEALKKQGEDNQFIVELLWREFAYYVLFYNPKISKVELKSKYSKFEWSYSDILYDKWKKGLTGFDIVDAGMRELWVTGTMHGRVRMIAASFLIKDLMIDWRIGEEWFWDTLVDADPAINPFSWQWVFGSGFDAAPYFRVFNPDSQCEKFDPNMTYCNKWLKDTSKRLKIVNHDKKRIEVLEKYKKINLI